MKCPKCQTENPATRKFCCECGAKLVQVCPDCGSENLPGDKFCGECGHELAVPPVASEPIPQTISFEEKLDKAQRYLPGGLTEKILAQRDTDETERLLRTTAFALSVDETRFFRYLIDFGNRLLVLRRHLKLVGEQELFADSIHRAQREDRVGKSLQRIQFFRYFGGKGMKVISVMWLICLTSGLLILVALDKIPENSLASLVSIPIAIGVIALGTTLSLGLRAMRSRE